MVTAAMQSLSLPHDLSQRILHYHTYRCMHHNESTYRSLLDGLSLNLSLELKLFMYRKMIREAPFFQGFPKTALHELVHCFQEAVYSPGDLIIRKGAIGEEMFFIVKGTIEVLPWLCWLLNRVLSWKVHEIQSFESTNRNISSNPRFSM